MSKGVGEESSRGAPWLAPESERGDRHQSTEAEFDGVVDVAAPINASSSARPVSQLMGSLSLSHGHDESPTAIHGRSISFADGLASLAAGNSSSEASPSRSAAGASTTSSCSPSRNQNQSWPGFANVYGSPALSCQEAGDNWVESIDRAIAEMGDPATLPSALERLSTDPYAPGDICESACWGDFVDSLPRMLLDERRRVARSAAALAAAVMDEATGGGATGGGGCCPAQLSDVLGAVATALGQACLLRLGREGEGDGDGDGDGNRAACAASASLAARALLALPRSWAAAREGVLSRACRAAASLLVPPPPPSGEEGGEEEGEEEAPTAPRPAAAASFLVAALLEEHGEDSQNSSFPPSSSLASSPALALSWLHRWAGTPRVARHLFAALGPSAAVEGHAAAVARLCSRKSASSASPPPPPPAAAEPALALSVALVAAALGSAHGRGLLSDPEGAAADLCSLATAESAPGSNSSPRNDADGEGESTIICSSARLGVLQLATSSPSALLRGGGSVGQLLGPLLLSLAAAAASASASAAEGRDVRGKSTPESDSVHFAARALCLLCCTPAGIDALLRGGGGGGGEEGDGGGIPWPRASSSPAVSSPIIKLLLSQQQQQRGKLLGGPLAALERALRGDPLARLHFAAAAREGRAAAAAEVAVALASRGAPPAALPSLAAAGAGDPLSLAREVIAEVEKAKAKAKEGVPPHVAAAAAAVALAEAGPAASAFAAALLVRGGGEGGEGGEKASDAPFRLPESAVAAALAVADAAAAAAAAAAALSGPPAPLLPPWCAREMPAMEALLAPSSSSSSSSPSPLSSVVPPPSTKNKETGEFDPSSSPAVALTAVSR